MHHSTHVIDLMISKNLIHEVSIILSLVLEELTADN